MIRQLKLEFAFQGEARQILMDVIYSKRKTLGLEVLSSGQVKIRVPNRTKDAVIREFAEKSDCVIVGRCADYMLREMNPVRLFVYADMESRIARCRKKNKDAETLNDRELRQKIISVDKKRARYYQFYANQVWGEKENYDLCINTTNLSIERAAGLVADFFRQE